MKAQHTGLSVFSSGDVCVYVREHRNLFCQALLRKGFSSSRNAAMRVAAHPIPAAADTEGHYRLVVSPQECCLSATDHITDLM